jgi:hypothetical protein
MPLDFTNIVPENNLRLPDALTIKYGPAPLLSRFVLAADRAARRKGILLRVRHDFDELVQLNKFYVARDLWYPILDAFNPRCAELTPENAYWISGENEDGEIVMTNACRVLDWTGTSLAEQACSLWYGRDAGQRCVVTAEMAHQITGVVAWGGASWVRPDFRGRQLSYLTPRILKAYACARWPIDWSICYIGIDNVKRGLAATYGHQNLSYSIEYPDSPHGEQVLGYSSTGEFYADIAKFMERGAVLEADDFDLLDGPTGFEHIVTKTSPEGVLHGSISRS